MRAIRLSTGAVLAALLLSLTACVPAVNPVASPSPTAAPTLEPTMEPTAAAATSIVITAQSLNVVTGGELTQSWGYVDGKPDEVQIPALTDIFGSSPTLTNDTVPCEGAPCQKSTASWGGFTVTWYPDPTYPDGMFISTTVPRVGDVEISSVDGSTVGDDLQALSESDPQFVRDLQSPDGNILQVGVGAVDPGVDGSPFPEFAIFVALEGSAPFDTVTTISAPRQNFGL